MDSPRSSRPPVLLRGVGSLVLATGAILLAWRCTVVPLEEREDRMASEYAALGEQIEKAHRSIKEVQALEQQSGSVAQELAELHRDHPAGPPVVWLPRRVEEQLQSFHCAGARMQLGAIRNVPDLAGYTRIHWEIEMPVNRTTRDIRNALFAILEIEAADPFVRVQQVVIGPDSTDPGRHLATATISLLAPRE